MRQSTSPPSASRSNGSCAAEARAYHSAVSFLGLASPLLITVFSLSSPHPLLRAARSFRRLEWRNRCPIRVQSEPGRPRIVPPRPDLPESRRNRCWNGGLRTDRAVAARFGGALVWGVGRAASSVTELFFWCWLARDWTVQSGALRRKEVTGVRRLYVISIGGFGVFIVSFFVISVPRVC